MAHSLLTRRGMKWIEIWMASKFELRTWEKLFAPYSILLMLNPKLFLWFLMALLVFTRLLSTSWVICSFTTHSYKITDNRLQITHKSLYCALS